MSPRLSDRRAAALVTAALLSVAAFPVTLHAATWTGGSSSNWTDANNWGGIAPVAGDSLLFTGANVSTNNDYTPDTQFSGIAFDASANLFTLGGNSINLAGGITNNATSNAHIISLSTIHLMGNSNFNLFATTGSMAMSSNIDAGVAGPVTLNLASSGGANTISGVIANGSSSALTVNVTTGTWAFTNSNTFTGNLTVGNGAILRADDGSGVPTASALLLNGGVLETGASVSRPLGTAAGKVQLTGIAAGFSARSNAVNVNLDGGATVVWGGPNFNTSTLTLQTSSANATITFQNAIDLNGVTRTVAVNNSNTTNIATISGGISDSLNSGAGLTKVGAGVLALTGTNTFSGPLAINGGTVRADEGSSLPSGVALSLNNGVLDTTASLSRPSGLGTGAGQVQLIGAAPGFSARTNPVSVGIGAANSTLTWGSTYFSPSTLTLQASTASSPLTFNNGLDLDGGVRVVAVNNSNNTNTATVTGTVTDTVGTGGLNKIGSGTLILASVGAISAVTATAGGIVFPAGYVAGAYALSGGSVFLTPASGNVNIGGAITGTSTSGGLVISANTPADSTITLTNAGNTFLAPITVNGGTLIANSFLGSGTTTLAMTNNVATDLFTTLRTSGSAAIISRPITINNTSFTRSIYIKGDKDLTLNGNITNPSSHGSLSNQLSPGASLIINGAIYCSNSTTNRTLHIAGTGKMVINGPVANSAAPGSAQNCTIAFDGGTASAGQFAIINSSSLTYTGGTPINGGTVIFNNALPSQTFTGSSSANSYIAVTGAGAIAYGGTGGITNAAFLAQLAGAQSYVNNASANSMATGALCIASASDAAVSIDFNSAKAFADVSSGTSTGSWGSMGLGAAGGAFTYSGTLSPLNTATGEKTWRLGGGNGTLTINQALDNGSGPGSGTLSILGGNNGVLILNAPASYTGNTSLTALQTLKNGVDNAIGQTGTLTLNGLYDLNGHNQTTRNLAGTGTLTASTGASVLTTNPTNSSVFNGVVSGNVGISQNGTGTLTLGGTVNYSGPTSVTGTMILGGTNNAAVSVAAIAGTGKLQIATNITATTGAAAVGTLQIDANSTQTIRTGSGTSKVSTLTLAGGTGAWNSKLDITNNVLVVQSADAPSKAAAMATVLDQVTSGKNGGAWTGNGITSSSIPGNPNATLAVSDNADLGWTSSGGQALDSNSIVVTRALIGDVNLDGNVDLADYDRWYKHVGTGTPFSYAAGDINMDGNIDLADYDLWYKHVGAAPLTLASQPALGGGVSAVPEPASLAVLALGSAALLGSRRRRK